METKVFFLHIKVSKADRSGNRYASALIVNSSGKNVTDGYVRYGLYCNPGDRQVFRETLASLPYYRGIFTKEDKKKNPYEGDLARLIQDRIGYAYDNKVKIRTFISTVNYKDL